MALLTKLSQVLTTDISTDFMFKKKKTEFTEYSLLDDMKKRRSVYKLSNRVIQSREYLTDLIKEAVHCCPSVLNSQSVRVVILYEDTHYQFWQLVKEVQRTQVPAHIYEGVALKVDRCAEAYGTVLFFEDQEIVKNLQKQKPLQAEEFKRWSEQTSGMAQFAVWTALSSIELGASLHHYNPAINTELTTFLQLPKSWELKAQLIFGSILVAPEPKERKEDDVLFRVFF
ncbi:nitroreductase family protein [Acinetobacter silvestris]|uniref:Nitroreductase domain-containing protein n=1 Tax=Acinetobacter silvestris TaxID=1977882 RepID=A0A1Y3CFM2_9GAMM|nr:nitroreductase family protein [Acinetobacter silvestris]OTG65146.1 hypothetical protein B9T28_10170 [Acinetobacter silvestris]